MKKISGILLMTAFVMPSLWGAPVQGARAVEFLLFGGAPRAAGVLLFATAVTLLYNEVKLRSTIKQVATLEEEIIDLKSQAAVNKDGEMRKKQSMLPTSAKTGPNQ